MPLPTENSTNSCLTSGGDYKGETTIPLIHVLHQGETTQWLEIIKECEGPLFRGITNNHKTTGQLGAGQVNRIYKKTARNAQLDENLIERISGHSCRVGAAQDLVSSGASLPIIMSKGRWSKTDTVMRYVEHISQAI